MEFQTLIENRRSVRKYSSDTNVTREQIQQLVQAALEAHHGRIRKQVVITVFYQRTLVRSFVRNACVTLITM